MIIGTLIEMAHTYGFLNAVMLLAVLVCLIITLIGMVTDRRSMERFQAAMATKRSQQIAWDRKQFIDEMVN